MRFKLFLMVLISEVWRTECDSDTAYHYISQVSDTTPQTLAPKPLFSPHDSRRPVSRSRGVYTYQSSLDRDYRYGTQHHPVVSTEQNLLNDGSSTFGGNDRLWYPVYTDIQYPGLLGVSPTTYDLSYGSLPAGYEPRVPLRGDPLGFSYTYSADDHKSHMTSDGRGNFYSSFSFVPPPGSPEIQSKNFPTLGDSIPIALPPQSYPSHIPPSSHVPVVRVPSTSDYGVYSSSRSPVVNHHRRVYSTAAPVPYNPSTARPIYAVTSSSTVRPVYSSPPNDISFRPIDATTRRPLLDPLLPNPVNDFTNGFNFVAKNYPSKRIPENTFNINSHALSTNIQHNNLPQESSSRTNNIISNTRKSTGSRHVTIVPPDPVEPRVTTEGSYQTLSRSLPLAFSSAVTTLSPVINHSTYKPRSSSSSRRFSTQSPVSSSTSYSSESPWASPLSRRLTTLTPVSSTSYSTERPWSSLAPRRFPTDRSRSSSIQTIRSAARRSTTERPVYAASRRSTTILPPPSSSKKPSVVQKIPRKMKNKTNIDLEESARPNFIDDLTSLAYSSDNVSLKNNSIIQIKQRRDKSISLKLPDFNEKTLVQYKSQIAAVNLNNSSGTLDSIIKDGYVTGNKTYLAGLGLRTNIHY